MELARIVRPLRTEVVYLVVVLVHLLQEPVHLVDVVPVDTLQLLGREAHRDDPICYICEDALRKLSRLTLCGHMVMSYIYDLANFI